MSSILSDFLAPPFCISCQRFGNFICEKCVGKFQFFDQSLPLQIDHPALDELYATVRFKPPASDFIHQIKFNSYWSLTDIVGEMMSVFLPLNTRPDVLTSIPLHKDREWNRGFNQAEKIARNISSNWKVPYQSFLFRKKSTTPQAELNRAQRLTHLQGAFIYKSGKDIENKVVGLVDDVTTTGTTLNECAKILKQYGAKRVIGLVFAHGN